MDLNKYDHTHPLKYVLGGHIYIMFERLINNILKIGIIRRTWMVISTILSAVFVSVVFILAVFGLVISIFSCIVITLIEISILPLYFLIWILTGRWLFWTIMSYLYDKTPIFFLLKYAFD